MMYRTILVALDGSACSVCAGRWALALAATGGAEVLAGHVYSAPLHAGRFRQMEPGLPEEYRRGPRRDQLRARHDALIDEGFRALSEGYVEAFVSAAAAADIKASPVTASGRNYVELLRVAARRRTDLIVCGSVGLGDLGDGLLGSTAARLLSSAPCDVLIARSDPAGGAVLAGIDGSDAALVAAERAAVIALALDRPLLLAAAYDPRFHCDVFRTMSNALPPERQEQVGLARQEELHESLINDGLAKLYSDFLDAAAERTGPTGRAVLTGKAYRALADHAEAVKADLTVVGRHGQHRDSASVGSVADGLARTSRGNVLVVGPPHHAADVAAGAQKTASGRASEGKAGAPAGPTSEPDRPTVPPSSCDSAVVDMPHVMSWDADAAARLERIPAFVRPMARKAIESAARRAGADRVTMPVFEAVANRFGMGARP